MKLEDFFMDDIAHFISATRYPVLERAMHDGRETLVPDLSEIAGGG
jgi:hypothetical protein